MNYMNRPQDESKQNVPKMETVLEQPCYADAITNIVGDIKSTVSTIELKSRQLAGQIEEEIVDENQETEPNNFGEGFLMDLECIYKVLIKIKLDMGKFL